MGGWLETDNRAISVQLNLTGTATGTELGNFEDLVSKVMQEGLRVLPDVFVYAMVLNRLVGAMKYNRMVLKACKKVWT